MTAALVGCPKQAHPTRRAARVALNACRARRISESKRRERSVYRCPLCEHWHLTSQPPRPKKAHR